MKEKTALEKLLVPARFDRTIEQANEAFRESERRKAENPVPFDPRTEVSADAKRIVANLWIIFVVVPIAVCAVYGIVSGIFHA